MMDSSLPPESLKRRQLLMAGAALAVVGCGESRKAHPESTNGVNHADEKVTTRQVAVTYPRLMAHAVLLPGLVNSATSGSFIDLLHAMIRVYSEGQIDIEAYPVERAVDNVVNGVADFGLPELRLYPGYDDALPYRSSTASFGKVSFVLYSRKKSPLTESDIRNAVGEHFHYVIEAPPLDWGFPIREFTTFESAFKKLDAGRIDGFLWAQEEADTVLRTLKFKSIKRVFFKEFEDVFMLPRSPRGDFVDGVLSQVIQKLKASGQLQELYGAIHRPYDDWQP